MQQLAVAISCSLSYLLIDFKKRKDFTPKKEDNTLSKRRKSKSINKDVKIVISLQ